MPSVSGVPSLQPVGLTEYYISIAIVPVNEIYRASCHTQLEILK